MERERNKRTMKRGYFITFEGGDGSGKSTQIKLLQGFLTEQGYHVLLTREPGGTAISEKIRDIILDKKNAEMCDMTETMLYAAARAQLVQQVIKPAVDGGDIVICDRFVDSSIAYQAWGRGLGDLVWDINRHAVGDYMPDLTILLKLDPMQGMKRIKSREQDRIELSSDDFHRKVYEGYLNLEAMDPDRIKGIDASQEIDRIAEQIRDLVEDLINR